MTQGAIFRKDKDKLLIKSADASSKSMWRGKLKSPVRQDSLHVALREINPGPTLKKKNIRDDDDDDLDKYTNINH